MLGPEALKEAAWWASLAADAGQAAISRFGESLAEGQALSRAAAYAQISQAYAAVAQAAAFADLLGIQQGEDVRGVARRRRADWEVILRSSLPDPMTRAEQEAAR